MLLGKYEETTTPPLKRFRSPAPATPLSTETTGVGLRPDDQTDRKPTAQLRPLTQPQDPVTEVFFSYFLFENEGLWNSASIFNWKLTKEPQKLGASQHSALPPEKLTRFTDFTRWEARSKDYLQGVNAKAQSGAIMALLDDEVYDPTRSTDISAASTPLVVLDGLSAILGSFEYPWVLQSHFQCSYQQPIESINDFQLAF
ncbi:unnamed protein product [Schistocephalus solidus]|uniref:Uncharacterized protein n=1 Tax=Schistocephalus solidus TaxID=70667 RepID=A0A183TCY9_SCHSO|nr:unnamed protein product [Schistocephalus solidus]